MDPIHALAAHVASRSLGDMPDHARAAARTFILDTLGVGVFGSTGPKVDAVVRALAGSGQGEATVWGTGQRLPAAAVALVNATQAHNSEFDCVHETAVVHAMSVVLPCALAGAERAGAVSGGRLVEAVCLGVDVAAGLGLAARSGLRFFRPATAGAFGGVAALGKLMGLDQATLAQAFSIVYGQVCGTMQSHTEGSMLLALQVGFNARNAVLACDLAQAGVEGPQHVLEGPFGYFRLIEDGGDMAPVLRDLGRIWRVAEIAHKPYPSGRATHGIIDACLELRPSLGDAAAIARVEAHVPPLVHRLVGRPWREDMPINYARLSAAYLAARTLVHGAIDHAAYGEDAYRERAVGALARRVTLSIDDRGDPNALTPVRLEITRGDGSRLRTTVQTVYGNPARPMSREAHLAKLRGNMASLPRPIPREKVERLIDEVDHLETCRDVASLAELLVP